MTKTGSIASSYNGLNAAEKETLTSMCFESFKRHGLFVVVVFVAPFIIVIWHSSAV